MKSCNLAAHPASRFPIHACVLLLFFFPLVLTGGPTHSHPDCLTTGWRKWVRPKVKQVPLLWACTKKATFPIGSITMSSCSPDTQSHTAEKALSSPVASHLPYTHFFKWLLLDLHPTKIRGLFFSAPLRLASVQPAARFNLKRQPKQQPKGKSLILCNN